MTRIKQAGPPMLIVALIACVVGYFFGSTRSPQQQEAGAFELREESVAVGREPSGFATPGGLGLSAESAKTATTYVAMTT